MKMGFTVFFAFFLLNHPSSLKAQVNQISFQDAYRFFQTNGFQYVIRGCSAGRTSNRLGYPFATENFISNAIIAGISTNFDRRSTNNVISALLRVMKETCPEIW